MGKCAVKKYVYCVEKNVEPNFDPDRSGNSKHSNTDIAKEKTLLGYDSQYSIRGGIELAIVWIVENMV